MDVLQKIWKYYMISWIMILLDIYSKEWKSAYDRDICTLKVILALFKAFKLWGQSRLPSTDEWVKKLWLIYTVKYYPAMKKNKNVMFARLRKINIFSYTLNLDFLKDMKVEGR
jgi:hypothetical protein